ncbi:MAG TPA: hypothetical protein ENI73_09380 [Spirochaetes bacterium]|nr:hypothetical protein [Spirochaetota bacterium]
MKHLFVYSIIFSCLLILTGCPKKTSPKVISPEGDHGNNEAHQPDKSFHNGNLPGNEDNYDLKYFTHRNYCAKNNQYRYFKAIDPSTGKELKKYFEVLYYKNTRQIALESSHIDSKTPHGIWYYNNPKGLKTRIEEYKYGDLDEETLFEYDDTGNKKSETIYIYKDGKKKLRVKSLYVYKKSPDKKVLEKIEYFNAGYLDASEEFEYNSKGQVSKKSFYHIQFERFLNRYILYNYDSKGNLLKEEVYNKDNKRVAMTKYKYNKQKLLLSKRRYEVSKNDQPVLVSRTTKKYNKEGDLLKETLKEKPENHRSLKTIFYKKFFYDAYNCIRCEKHYDHRGKLIRRIGCKK